ncbi:MAG TPA: type VI secretion system baseplate subunit TssE [Bryobacteraceae bacterium]|jgi:type VI secretion system protein ImpF|nr:type VI secretion system baseplate subunit TssE [Bryobacteraceae bacterium]
MANPKLIKNVQQGLLDRLVDLEPDNRFEAPMSRAESVRQLRLAVKRDLEWLLNSTRMLIEVPESCEEIEDSVIFYGLPDISSMSVDSSSQFTLQKSLERAIEKFEPRLARARVTSRGKFRATNQSVTFHVEATLMMDPIPERFSFDTVLEISKGAYTVKED